ncbi:MAG TPA: energy transducer TonB, partial [Terriglobales bacterium]|nr:energy transducer TonB [Terriglobales bacterium]
AGRNLSLVPPTPVRDSDPDYSENARRAKISGMVTVLADVGADGCVYQEKVLKSLDRELDEASLDAVSQWKFKPATKAGIAIPVRVKIDVDFRIFD